MVGKWTLGPYICDLWITSDVFCCTASILNIVVIALDRYWLITRNVRYTHSTVLPRRTVCSVLLTAAWLVSALIASSPLMGWRTGTERDDPSACLISQDYGYTVFSTFGAFWFPLGVILVVYARIFVFARRRASRRRTVRTGNGFKPSQQQLPAVKAMSAVVTGGGRRSAAAGGGSGGGGVAFPGDTSICAGGTSPSGFDELQLPTIAYADRSDSLTPQESTGRTAVDGPSNCVTGCDMTDNTGMTTVTADVTSVARNRKSRRRAMRMRRSARTLGLIIGGFLVCWLPFFVVATTVPFCPSCDVPPTVASVVLWLGYSNSLLNPAIYAIWDQSFRRSFHRIVTCNTVKY